MKNKIKLLKLKYSITTPFYENVIAYSYHGIDVNTKQPLLIWQYKVPSQNALLIKRLIEHSEKLIELKHDLLIPMIDYVFDGQSFFTVHENESHLVSLESYLQQPNGWDLKVLWSFVRQLLQLLLLFEQHQLYCGSISTSLLNINQNGQLKVLHPVVGVDVLAALLPNTAVLDDCLFLAPEFIYKRSFFIASDIYAIGVLCYFLFSNNWPYPFTFSINQYKENLVNNPATFIKRDPQIPNRLGLLIMKCLDSDYQQRFGSINSLIKAYKGLLPLDVSNPNRPPTMIQKQIAHEIRKQKENTKKNRLRWSLCSGAILCMCGLMMFWYMSYVNAIPTQLLPNVVGMPIEHAITVLKSSHFRIKLSSNRIYSKYKLGTVIDMSPSPGRTVKQNREIRLFVSSGSAPIIAPDLIGRTKKEVDRLLKAKNITLKVEHEEFSALFPKNTVIKQTPSPNNVLNESNIISIVLSNGFPLTVTTQPLSRGFFSQNQKLRTHIHFDILDGWPKQQVQITYLTTTTLKLYDKFHTAGDQVDLTYKIEKGGILNIYFNGDIAYSEMIN